MVDRAWVRRWVDGFEAAWRTHGTEELAAIFSRDAIYLHSPYADAVEGLPKIRTMWEEDRNGPEERFTLSTEIVAVEEGTAVVRALVRYGEPMRQEYTDLWVLRFDDEGRCSRFEEWPYWSGRGWSAQDR